MGQEIDYESVGRYHTAADKAKKLCQDYNRAIKHLAKDLDCSGGLLFESMRRLPSFDANKLRKQFEDVATLYADLITACHEANVHAAKCGQAVFNAYADGVNIPV
jgi:hypothetical protein